METKRNQPLDLSQPQYNAFSEQHHQETEVDGVQVRSSLYYDWRKPLNEERRNNLRTHDCHRQRRSNLVIWSLLSTRNLKAKGPPVIS